YDYINSITPNTPVIILSGMPDSELTLNILEKGAEDFLVKGDFDHKLLAKTICYSIERKKFRKNIELDRERYKIVANSSHDMIWDWNYQENTIFRSPEGLKNVFGLSPDFSGNRLEDWLVNVHPEDHDIIRNVFVEAEKDPLKKTFSSEYRFIHSSGKILYIHDRGSVIRDNNGKPVRFIGASQDITERKDADWKIRESEYRFRSLVQSSSDLIGVIDPQGIYTYVSPTASRVLGHFEADLVGKSAFDYIHPDDAPDVINSLMLAEEGQNLKLAPFRFRNSGGEWKWIETILTKSLTDPAIAGIIANSRDITEEKRIKEEMQRLSILAKETVNGVLITNANEEIIWVNDSFTKMTGYDREEVMGKKPGTFLQGKETTLGVKSYIKNQIKRRLPFDCEIVNYHKDGRKLWVRLQGQPIFDEQGKLEQFFALQTDITKEKEALISAEFHREQFQALIQHSFDVVEVVDNQGKVKYISPAISRMFGFSPEEIEGRSGFEFIHPEDKSMVYEKMNNLLNFPDKAESAIIKMIAKDGSWRVCDVHAENLLDNPYVNGIVINYRDITENKKLEKMLMREKVNRQKQITMASIRMQEKEREVIGRELHDNVNQILSTARLFLELAGGNVDDHFHLQKSKEHIQIAIQEIRKLSKELVPPSMNDLGLKHAIGELFETISLLQNVEGNVRLEFDETQLNDIIKLTIYRVLQEQVTNIIKYSNASKVYISVVEDESYLVVKVADNGVGFQFRDKKDGIGLKNINSRVQAVDGIVNITTEPGKGCEMVVKIPLKNFEFNTEQNIKATMHR
ncbi:MAG: PAS domain S-box protein, partial [Flavitalea sp.]